MAAQDEGPIIISCIGNTPPGARKNLEQWMRGIQPPSNDKLKAQWKKLIHNLARIPENSVVLPGKGRPKKKAAKKKK